MTRVYIEPLTRQCAAIGVPATVSVPAATAVADSMLEFANEILHARSVQDCSVAPVAALSCSSSSSSLPPQALKCNKDAATVTARLRRFLKITVCLLLGAAVARQRGLMNT